MTFWEKRGVGEAVKSFEGDRDGVRVRRVGKQTAEEEEEVNVEMNSFRSKKRKGGVSREEERRRLLRRMEREEAGLDPEEEELNEEEEGEQTKTQAQDGPEVDNAENYPPEIPNHRYSYANDATGTMLSNHEVLKRFEEEVFG